MYPIKKAYAAAYAFFMRNGQSVPDDKSYSTVDSMQIWVDSCRRIYFYKMLRYNADRHNICFRHRKKQLKIEF